MASQTNEEWEVVHEDAHEEAACTSFGSSACASGDSAERAANNGDDGQHSEGTEPLSTWTRDTREDSPDTADGDDWSSISPEDVIEQAGDTLDMSASAYGSSSASDVAVNSSEVQEEAADDQAPAPVVAEAPSPPELTSPAAAPRALSPRSVHDSKACSVRTRSVYTRLERSIRACVDMVVRFFGGAAQSSRHLFARVNEHLKNSRFSELRHYALPVTALSGVAALVVFLLRDNHRLRHELKCSCSDEKINRLIVSGLRMKAALHNATEFNGSLRAATFFV